MGVVAQVGEGVTGWREGDRVTAAPWTYAEQGHGTWQEYALVKAEHLVRAWNKPLTLTLNLIRFTA